MRAAMPRQAAAELQICAARPACLPASLPAYHRATVAALGGTDAASTFHGRFSGAPPAPWPLHLPNKGRLLHCLAVRVAHSFAYAAHLPACPQNFVSPANLESVVAYLALGAGTLFDEVRCAACAELR